jgi:16S rRNA (cytidine1402-2'-O)-methyltransferase
MFTLYVVSTPIGNLEDMSFRAIRILKEVNLIACEDTRKTQRLLNTYKIETPFTSYHQYSKASKLDHILRFLTETGDVAVVSEAGTPGISDPGHELIVAAVERGIAVVPVPGPSVVMAALAVSALSTDRFLFLGFLPRTSARRRRFLEEVREEPVTLLVLESPHRVAATLHDLYETLGDRRIAVCRELTKIHEEVFRGRITEAIEKFNAPRGEFTLVIDGSTAADEGEPAPSAEAHLEKLRRQGVPAKEAISRVSAETSLPRRELYRIWVGLQSRPNTSKQQEEP